MMTYKPDQMERAKVDVYRNFADGSNRAEIYGEGIEYCYVIGPSYCGRISLRVGLIISVLLMAVSYTFNWGWILAVIALSIAAVILYVVAMVELLSCEYKSEVNIRSNPCFLLVSGVLILPLIFMISWLWGTRSLAACKKYVIRKSRALQKRKLRVDRKQAKFEARSQSLSGDVWFKKP